MTMHAEPLDVTGFAQPYLQPDGSMDCGYYATAYVCHLLGHPDVTAEQIKTWRAETKFHETYYPGRVLDAEMRRWAEDRDDEDKRRLWWLGPGSESWVRGWLAGGYIALVMVMRRPEYGHSVVLLDADDSGVLLMDPWPAFGGFIRESWDWFLGQGPGNHGAHHIEGWFRNPAPLRTFDTPHTTEES